MPRMARIVAAHYPHHITQRGNYKQTVFSNDKDYDFYLERLNEYIAKYQLVIIAYCLMPNHVHFIAIPENKDSLAKTFNACHMRHAHYFNKMRRCTGHLWQGRFYSCVLDENHLYAAVRYVENNPVRAGFVKSPDEWSWSSAKEHMGKGKGKLRLADIGKFMEVSNWKGYLSLRDDKRVISRIRSNTLTGRPLGDDTFIEKLEKLFGKRLRALAHGRPRRGNE